MPRSLKTKTFDGYQSLLIRVKQTLIDGQARIEAERVKTYWKTGRIIHTDILKHNDRAEYGAEVLLKLAHDLKVDKTLLSRCINFFKKYPRLPIVAGRQQFNWSHYRELITIDDEKKRLSMQNTVLQKGWTAEELAARINNKRVDTDDGLRKRATNTGTGQQKLLTPNRGKLYTYTIVTRPQVALEKESGLLIDLGFGNFRNVEPRLLSSFADGDIVESRPALDAYKFYKGNRSAKDLFTYAAYIERVVDADTLKVRFDLGFDFWHRDTLRLRGLDAPEMGTPKGKAAKAFVQSYLKESQFVVVHSSRSDKYDRYLADVYIPQENGEELYLNNLLLENGYAVRMD